jgi:hypothetical protein
MPPGSCRDARLLAHAGDFGVPRRDCKPFVFTPVPIAFGEVVWLRKGCKRSIKGVQIDCDRGCKNRRIAGFGTNGRGFESLFLQR